jgi:hypothetical protein
LRTIAAVNRSMIAATDSHTDEGRYVRVIDKGLRRLIEDLNEMNAAS